MIMVLKRGERHGVADGTCACVLQDKLAEKGISNILCVSAAPGIAATSLATTARKQGGAAGMDFLQRFGQSPEDGSLPLLHAAVGADVQSGDHWVICLLPLLRVQ
jgi:hypothetical protein